jgi:hypothetical protein
MRKLFRAVPGPVCLLLFYGLFLVGWAGCGGCAAGKGQLNPATGIYDTNALADVVVVTAENLRSSALDVFDAFMRIEKNNEAVLQGLNPNIHLAAEDIRKHGAQYLDDLTHAKNAYQSARTPDNASKLESALAAVNSALVSVSKHLAEASAAITGKATP